METPTLPVGLVDPIALLEAESAAMRKAIAEIDGQIANAVIQKNKLLVMAVAFDNEIELLSEDVVDEQLSLDFGPN